MELDLKSKTTTEKYEAHFEFTNKSDKEIKFIKIKASCGCILTDSPESVAPGKSGKITFKAPVPYGGGKYKKVIKVDTDESEGIEYVLSFQMTNTDPYVPRKPKVEDNKPVTKTPDQRVLPKDRTYTRPANMNRRARLLEQLKAQQALARKKSYHIQEECPFLPLPIDKKLFHDYNGMRIYTCCEQCLVLVKESPHYAIIKLGEKTQTPVLLKDIK